MPLLGFWSRSYPNPSPATSWHWTSAIFRGLGGEGPPWQVGKIDEQMSSARDSELEA